MAEQRERMEKALRGCAEIGVPDAVDLWPAIRERVAAEPARPRRFRFLPRTRAGVALAAVLVMLLGMGAYGASGPIYEEFRLQLPGAKEKVFGERVDQTQTANGVRVDVGWAYADARSVVVGFGIKDLKENRRVAGHPAQLGPADFGKLTDESGTGFHVPTGQYTSGDQDPIEEVSGSMVFKAKEKIEPGQTHHFRLEIPVEAAALPSENQSEPVGKPFIFDFDIPVDPDPVVEVNQRDTASGVTLTLERVVNSPARPEAVVCFKPPDDEHDWTPYGGDLLYEGEPVDGEGNCRKHLLDDRLEGRSTVTVAQIEGIPGCPPGDDNGCSIPNSKVEYIRGPWTFKLEVPKR